MSTSKVSATGGRPTVSALRALLQDLLDRWDQDAQGGTIHVARRPSNQQPATVLGLAAHAHRLGRVAASLIDQGLDIETAPTVRSVFEYGIAVQWIVQFGDDAMWAVAGEMQRSRRNLEQEIADLQRLAEVPGADEIRRLLAEDTEGVELERTAAQAGTRSFRARCMAFAGGPGYYVLYRILSGFVHPGPDVAGAYIDTYEPVSFASSPRPSEDAYVWLSNTCCGLLWSASAADMLDENRPRREYLRRAAATLGAEVEIPLTEEASRGRG